MKVLHSFPLRFTCLGIIIASACAAGSAVGGTAAAGAGAPPESDPARLVAQLGDTDQAVRRAAAWRLREIGAPALPALREAADSPDPEVQAAARAALKAIDRPPLPEAGDGPSSTQVIQADEDRFAVDFHEGKRVVRVEGDVRKPGKPYGRLKLTFTGPVDGKETTQTFSADDEEQLKWDAPQAWIYFHGIFNHESDKAAVRVPHRALTTRVNAEMDRLNLPADERKQVEDRLQRFADASTKALVAVMYEPDEAPQRRAEEYRESDALRAFLTERKLPVVEGAWEMSPPKEARLGIDFSTDPREVPAAAGPGLLVKVVATGERADRIGVRAGDVIQRIDGTAVPDGARLRLACSSRPAGMTIEVYRDGKTVTLAER